MQSQSVDQLKTASAGRCAKPLASMLRAWAAVALCAAPAAGLAARPAPSLTVSGAWIRALGGPTPAAAYFTLSNASSRPFVLVGAASPDCGELMMHQSRTVHGVASMAMVAQRIVPAHGQVVFSPGEYHLMCISPSKAVRPGARIPITLRFADGQRLQVRFAVRPLGE